jgi:hypothetical protein
LKDIRIDYISAVEYQMSKQIHLMLVVNNGIRIYIGFKMKPAGVELKIEKARWAITLKD